MKMTFFALGDRKSTRLNSSHANISYAVFCSTRPHPTSTLFPYTTLFRSLAVSLELPRAGHHLLRAVELAAFDLEGRGLAVVLHKAGLGIEHVDGARPAADVDEDDVLRLGRSEEHTSELQSRQYLVCRLLLDSPTPDIYTLSLHDALPISCRIAGTSTGWPSPVASR